MEALEVIIIMYKDKSSLQDLKILMIEKIERENNWRFIKNPLKIELDLFLKSSR